MRSHWASVEKGLWIEASVAFFLLFYTEIVLLRNFKVACSRALGDSGGPLEKFTCLFTDPIYFLFNIVFTWRHGGHICVQNNEPAAMFVYKKNPVGIELFSHVKTFFYSKQFAKLLTTWLKTMYRIHVAVRLFFNRSQMTSKCGRHKEVAHEPQASASLMFLPHFDVFFDVLRNLPMATWNLFVL